MSNNKLTNSKYVDVLHDKNWLKLLIMVIVVAAAAIPSCDCMPCCYLNRRRHGRIVYNTADIMRQRSNFCSVCVCVWLMYIAWCMQLKSRVGHIAAPATDRQPAEYGWPLTGRRVFIIIISFGRRLVSRRSITAPSAGIGASLLLLAMLLLLLLLPRRLHHWRLRLCSAAKGWRWILNDAHVRPIILRRCYCSNTIAAALPATAAATALDAAVPV